MRIKKLEIENINSLKGKWAIDFEDENYQNSGLLRLRGRQVPASLRFLTG